VHLIQILKQSKKQLSTVLLANTNTSGIESIFQWQINEWMMSALGLYLTLTIQSDSQVPMQLECVSRDSIP